MLANDKQVAGDRPPNDLDSIEVNQRSLEQFGNGEQRRLPVRGGQLNTEKVQDKVYIKVSAWLLLISCKSVHSLPARVEEPFSPVRQSSGASNKPPFPRCLEQFQGRST